MKSNEEETAKRLISGWQGLWLIKTCKATENLEHRIIQCIKSERKQALEEAIDVVENYTDYQGITLRTLLQKKSANSQGR